MKPIVVQRWRRVRWPAHPALVDRYAASDLVPVSPQSALQPTDVEAGALLDWEARQIVDALAANPRRARGLDSIRGLLDRIDEVYKGAQDIAEYVLGAAIEVWDVGTADNPRRWAFWLYGIDCGRIYKGESTKFVGSVSQGHLTCDLTRDLTRDDAELWPALGLLEDNLRKAAPESQLARTRLKATR